jgi:hypothetical protein
MPEKELCSEEAGARAIVIFYYMDGAMKGGLMEGVIA